MAARTNRTSRCCTASHTDDPNEVARAVAGFGSVRIRLGRTSVFLAPPGGEYDVVKVDVDSADLHRLHQRIADALPHTDTHPKYVPHLTLAYVKAGRGAKHEGLDSLVGREFAVTELVFSDRDGLRTTVPLTEPLTEPPLALPVPCEPPTASLSAEFDESKIKRDEDGQFAEKGGAEGQPVASALLLKDGQRAVVREFPKYFKESGPTRPIAVTALNVVPAPIHRLIAASDRRVEIGETVIGMEPSLKGLVPTGHTAESTFANIAGVYLPAALYPPGRALIATHAVPLGGDEAIALTLEQLQLVAAEEMAHSLDEVIGFSDTDRRFAATYDRESAAVPRRHRRLLRYWLQTQHDAGRRETFARFAVFRYTSDRLRDDRDAMFARYFWSCGRLARDVFDRYELR